jgi:hypothetical protein
MLLEVIAKFFLVERQNHYYTVLINIANAYRVIVIFQGHLDFVSMRENNSTMFLKKKKHEIIEYIFCNLL